MRIEELQQQRNRQSRPATFPSNCWGNCASNCPTVCPLSGPSATRLGWSSRSLSITLRRQGRSLGDSYCERGVREIHIRTRETNRFAGAQTGAVHQQEECPGGDRLKLAPPLLIAGHAVEEPSELFTSVDVGDEGCGLFRSTRGNRRTIRITVLNREPPETAESIVLAMPEQSDGPVAIQVVKHGRWLSAVGYVEGSISASPPSTEAQFPVHPCSNFC